MLLVGGSSKTFEDSPEDAGNWKSHLLESGDRARVAFCEALQSLRLFIESIRFLELWTEFKKFVDQT